MKKIVLILVAFLLATGLLFAAGTIVIQGVEGQEASIIRQITPVFEKQTGVTVKYDFVTFDFVREKQMTQLSAHTGAYDAIMVLNPLYFVEYAKSNFMVPLNEMIAQSGYNFAGLPQNLQDLSKDNNNILALPLTATTYFWLYRKDLFEKAGIKSPPATLDELLEDAKKLTNPPVYGVSSMGKRDFGTFNEWLHYLRAFGGDLLDSNNQPDFNNAAGIASINFHKSLMKYAPPGATAVGIYEHFNLVGSGNVAMAYISGVWGPQFERADLMGAKTAGKLGYFPWPVAKKGDKHVSAIVDGWWVAVAPDSKNREATFKYIAWLTGKDGQTLYANAGGVPARTSVIQDNPALIEKFPYLKIDLDYMKYGRPMPQVIQISEIVEATQEQLSAALAGTKTTKEALSALDAKVQGIMK